MKIKYLAPFVGATMILGAGVASAQTTSTGAVGGGSASATNQGATVSGGVAGGADAQAAPERQKKDKRHNRSSARDAAQSGADTSTQAPAANTATTYGAGAVHTDSNSTSAGVTSGGLATGTGSQSTSSTVDAYGETGKTGTSADIYGNSTASSTTPRR